MLVSMGIDTRHHCAYHPASGGAVERDGSGRKNQHIEKRTGRYCVNLSPVLLNIHRKVKDVQPKFMERELHELKPGDWIVVKDVRREIWRARRWNGCKPSVSQTHRRQWRSERGQLGDMQNHRRRISRATNGFYRTGEKQRHLMGRLGCSSREKMVSLFMNTVIVVLPPIWWHVKPWQEEINLSIKVRTEGELMFDFLDELTKHGECMVWVHENKRPKLTCVQSRDKGSTVWESPEERVLGLSPGGALWRTHTQTDEFALEINIFRRGAGFSTLSLTVRNETLHHKMTLRKDARQPRRCHTIRMDCGTYTVNIVDNMMHIVSNF